MRYDLPRRMTGEPVPRDVETGRDPDAVVIAQVLEETSQCGQARRSADQPAMQPDGEHLRRHLALLVERVERITQIVEELRA